jgi:hypothetical protein
MVEAGRKGDKCFGGGGRAGRRRRRCLEYTMLVTRMTGPGCSVLTYLSPFIAKSVVLA